MMAEILNLIDGLPHEAWLICLLIVSMLAWRFDGAGSR
jgi:hypothetical protein